MKSDALFDMAAHVLGSALYADEDQSQYIDWDLVALAYEAILDLARKGLAGGDA